MEKSLWVSYCPNHLLVHHFLPYKVKIGLFLSPSISADFYVLASFKVGWLMSVVNSGLLGTMLPSKNSLSASIKNDFGVTFTNNLPSKQSELQSCNDTEWLTAASPVKTG